MTLAAHGFELRYPGAAAPALARVDIEITPGELVVLAGENGCGKSTLCHALSGIAVPARGKVTLEGSPLDAPVPASIQLIQQSVEDQVVAPIVRDDVAFGVECLGLPGAVVAQRVHESLTAAGLAGFEERAVGTLSGGELARLALAGALAMRPRYLLADEPTAHLDPASADRFVALLRAFADRGGGVLLVSHRLEEARHADRLLLMHEGGIASEGAPRSLLYDDALLRAHRLEPPPIVQLVQRWRADGREVPGQPLHVEELAKSACLSST